MIKKSLLAFLLVASLFATTLPTFAQSADYQSSANTIIGQGIGYFYGGKLDEAIAALKQGIVMDPKHTGAYAFLALAYEKQGRVEEAAAALHARGVLVKDSKNYSAALENFNASYRLNPNENTKAQIEACEKALAPQQ